MHVAICPCTTPTPVHVFLLLTPLFPPSSPLTPLPPTPLRTPRRSSWSSHTNNQEVSELFSVAPSSEASLELTSLVQTSIDNLRLLSFSNAIMMETALMSCIEKLIDVVFEAVDCSACSVFVMENDMQSMKEITHSVYQRTDRRRRVLSARTGIGKKVLVEPKKWIYVEDVSSEPAISQDLRSQYQAPDGKWLDYPCALYTAVRDHVGRPLAVLETSFKEVTERNREIQKVQAIGVIAASALRGAKLHEEIQYAKRQSDALLEVNQALSEEGNWDDIIQRILRVAYDCVNPEKVVLYLVDEATGNLVCSEDPTDILLKGDGIEGTVAEEQELFCLNNMKADSEEDKSVKNLMCCPIVNSERQTVGVIKAINKRKTGKLHDFSEEEDGVILQAIGDCAGVALDKARLMESILAEQRKNDSMVRCMKAVKNSGESVDKLMHNLVSVAYDIIEVASVTLYLVDVAGGRLICTVSKDKATQGEKYPLGEGIAGRVAATGSSIRIDNCGTDERYDATRDSHKNIDTRNILCHPIRDHRKKVVAVIELVNKKRGSFTEHDTEVLETFEAEVSTALKKAALEMAAGSGEGSMLAFINMYSSKLMGGSKDRRRDGTILLPGQQAKLLSSPKAGTRMLDLKDLQVLDALKVSQTREKEHEKLKKWDFDVLSIDKSNLMLCCLDMFSIYNASEELKVDEADLHAFVVTVSKNYRENPFHAFAHGAAVMHIAFMMMNQANGDEFLRGQDCVAILIATLCHDLDHPGTTNDFQKNSLSNLALTYNDRSILENHHAATAFKIMQSEGSAILVNLPNNQFTYMRKMIIEMILKTDQAGHFDMVKLLQTHTDETENGEPFFDINQESSRVELMSMIVHGADLGNPAYPKFEMTKMWCFRVCEEFSSQVVKEKELGLPVTAFMEGLNNEVDIAKLQVGFVNYVILPLWNAMVILLPKLTPSLDSCVQNVKLWQKIIEDGEKESPADEESDDDSEGEED